MLDINRLEVEACTHFFQRVRQEVLLPYRGLRNQQYAMLYARYLLGICNKPHSNPRNKKQLEIREELYALVRDCGVTPRNYPDLI